ncbi:MAG: hypothetical protein A2790_13225 [Phenylobacterium sp. RIFCSPHIGHO2_01_FULL_69_31]|jgi:hypothetical protein|uniref:BLUF domain-containing protein n=1 Tax=Phenylobacterium sp. RIFCSPHIGHO2_01_FULL_69_31 TaxID=1801944 RepID=UPI0008BB54F3|nr:BLUF domain-containing protein [Phenylobacterium sp. RIFCSPHIGHO2_01_FULL_69_31]OHB29330.1 MAG: hypothetical protein A2790_13225 [Phenylobacterium sp. RIFCSPHIGHO2_01_FULL_69_31]
MLCRLLYVSRISDAAAANLPHAMEEILVVSARRNTPDAVTGLLLADGASFVQVLEGPDARVIACYERILQDQRHHDIRLRSLASIDERSFPRWSMCGLTLSDLEDKLLAASDIAFELREADPGALLQHLEGLAARHARQLDAAHAKLVAASSSSGRASPTV